MIADALLTNGRLNRVTSSDRIAATLRDQILTGAIRPGSPLREEDLAEEHKASRHVIREALRLLASEGLADYIPFRGAKVSLITESEVREIYRLRRFIELGAISEPRIVDAIPKLAKLHGEFVAAVDKKEWRKAFIVDLSFHSAIVAAIGSERLVQWHWELLQGLSLAHLVVPAFQEDGFSASMSEHAEVISVLATGDVKRARTALERHLDESEKILMERLSGDRVKESWPDSKAGQ